jgi:hypothetical protein
LEKPTTHLFDAAHLQEAQVAVVQQKLFEPAAAALAEKMERDGQSWGSFRNSGHDVETVRAFDRAMDSQNP